MLLLMLMLLLLMMMMMVMMIMMLCVWCCVPRFDPKSKQYVAGIMEEDDHAHPELQLIKTEASPGRTFTLYLYDREKNHVREASRRLDRCSWSWSILCGCVFTACVLGMVCCIRNLNVVARRLCVD
jgi:hypothetical protein